MTILLKLLPLLFLMPTGPAFASALDTDNPTVVSRAPATLVNRVWRMLKSRPTPSLDDLSESQLVFCHSTDILPFPYMKVGGRPIENVILDENGTVTDTVEGRDRASWPPVRATLHWGLNAAIPKADTVIFHEGKDRVVPATQRYGIIEPFAILKDHVYGGYVRDFYSIGDHQLSSQSILLVPAGEFDTLSADKPENFTGQILPYDYNPRNGQYAGWAIDKFLQNHASLIYMRNTIKIKLSNFVEVFAAKYPNNTQAITFIEDAYNYYTDVDDLQRQFSKIFGDKLSLQIDQNASRLLGRRDRTVIEVKHTVGEFREFRQVHFQNGLTVTERELIEYLRYKYGWKLKEPYFLHVESKFCKLEDEVGSLLLYGRGDKARLIQKLGVISKEVHEMHAAAGDSFDKWAARVEAWTQK